MTRKSKTSLVVVKAATNKKKNRSRKGGQEIQVRSGLNTSETLFRPNRNLFKHPTGAIANPRFRVGSKARGKAREALPHALSSYIDPFDENARGCRYPDEFRGLSDTYTCNTVGALSTPASAAGGSFTDLNMVGVTPTPGTFLCCFTPDPNIAVINGIAGAGGFAPWCWPNGAAFADVEPNSFGPSSGVIGTDITAGNMFPMRNAYTGCRLVSGGIKLSSNLNFSTVSGNLHIAPVFIETSMYASNNNQLTGFNLPALTTLYNSWTFSLPENLASMSTLPGYEQYALSSLQSDEIVAIFKRVSAEALLFKPVAVPWNLNYSAVKAADGTVAVDTKFRYGASDNPDSYGHYCIVVYVDGLTATNLGAFPQKASVLEFEMINHYECQINAFSGAIITAQGNSVAVLGMAQADMKQAAPHQPLLMAALDNMAADIPAIRLVDAAGVEEVGFVDNVIKYWKQACGIAASVKGAVDFIAPILGALVL